jgi:hypothetical protein
MNSALKTDLKAWLKKYLTPQQQRNHPFEEYERPVPPFQILKNEIKPFLQNMVSQCTQNEILMEIFLFFII